MVHVPRTGKTKYRLPGLTAEEFAHAVGVHRNTIARWAREGWLVSGQQVIHPSGRGRTTVYSALEVSRGIAIRRLLSEGLSSQALKAAIDQLDAADAAAHDEEAAAIYDDWLQTTSERLEGTSTEEQDAAGRIVVHVHPIPEHVRFRVGTILRDMGVAEERRDYVDRMLDGDIIREAIYQILTGFSPVLVITRQHVFVAADFDIAGFHAGAPVSPPAETRGAGKDFLLQHVSRAPGYITVRLRPILQVVWAEWGKREMPAPIYYPAPVVRARTGDEVVEYDCSSELHGASDHLVTLSPSIQRYTARRSALSQNPDLEMFLTGKRPPTGQEPPSTRKKTRERK